MPVAHAQTRSAAVSLGNRDIWDWGPNQALLWLDIQLRRQPHDGNLNEATAEILESTMPSPARVELARAFTDPKRFA